MSHTNKADTASRAGSTSRKATPPTDENITGTTPLAKQEQDAAGQGIAVQQPRKPRKSEAEESDAIELVCREKHMPQDAFMQFGPQTTTRGREMRPCVRVPVYDREGESHSHFDFEPGKKGSFAPGKGKSGMFFPGRLPVPGETWLLANRCEDAVALVGLGFKAAGLPADYLAADYAELFRGVEVVLVPDLVEKRWNGARRSGRYLIRIAASVRIARLPGQITKASGVGVRKILASEGGDKLVRDAIADAEPWKPSEGSHVATAGRPRVLITHNLRYVVDQVVRHLGKLGLESPRKPATQQVGSRVYHRGGILVHVVAETDAATLASGVAAAETARIRPLPIEQLLLRINEACELIQEKETTEAIEEISVLLPPRWLIDGVFTRGNYSGDISRLESIITAPTIRQNGTIIQCAGYDDQTGLLYIPSGQFPAVPQTPTQADAKAAAAELLDVVADFEFLSESDRTAWLAMLLSQIGREAIDGCVPMFAITANIRGSGKSLLADAASLIAYGRPAARKPYSSDDDEQRKAITATAIEALPSVLLDNVDRVLGGASLDAALTAPTWSDRLLGASRTTGALPLRTV